MRKSTAISTAKQKTLAFFCLYPDLQFHEREAVRQIGLGASTVHQALKVLAEEQFLSFDRKGKMVFYRLNESRPLIRQYKTMAVVFALEPLVMKLRNKVDQIVLYGSSATGLFLADSDVDLLIVTSHPDQVRHALSQFDRKFTKEIRPVIISLPEWVRYEEKDPVFYHEVSKGLVLHQSQYYESEV